MADNSSSIPPSSSSRSISASSTSSAIIEGIAPPYSSDSINLLIENAPQFLYETENFEVIEGRVIFSNPQKEEMRIEIDLGELKIKTKLDLPHDTKVSIKIHKIDGQLYANITVLEKADIPEAEIKVTPAIEVPQNIKIEQFPIVKEGQKLNANIIPSEKTQLIDKLVEIISTTDKTEISKIRFAVNPTRIEDILQSKQPEEILNSFSKETIVHITSTIKEKLNIPEKIENYSLNSKLIKQTYSQDIPNAKHITESNFQSSLVENTDEDLFQILSSPVKESAPSNIRPAVPSEKPHNVIEAAPRPYNKNSIEEFAPILDTSITKSMQTSADNILFNQHININAKDTPVHPVLSSKRYRIDIVKIIPQNTDKKEMAQYIKTINNDTNNYQTPEYKELPVKIGHIEDFTPQGHPIIKAEIYNAENIYARPETEHFIIQQNVNIDKDSLIMFKAVPVLSAPITEPVNTIDLTTNNKVFKFDPYADDEWTALKQTVQSAIVNSPPAAINISNIIPSPTSAANFVTTAMFFLSALRSGNLKDWLGEDNLKHLNQSDNDDTLDALSNDFTKLGGANIRDASGAQWRITSIPLYYEGKLEQLRLYVHDQESEEGNEINDKTTRFIFNLNLSNMGKLQLDGTINKVRKILNLDIRSELEFSSEIKNEITQKFIYGLEHVDMKGEVSFKQKIISL